MLKNRRMEVRVGYFSSNLNMGTTTIWILKILKINLHKSKLAGSNLVSFIININFKTNINFRFSEELRREYQSVINIVGSGLESISTSVL